MQDFPYEIVDRLTAAASNEALAPKLREDLQAMMKFLWAAKADHDRTGAIKRFEADGKFLTEPEIESHERKLKTHTDAMRQLGQTPMVGVIDSLIASHKNLHARTRDAAMALFFYANPDSYYAISITADRPAGDFADDMSKVENSIFDRPMPGRTARIALYGDGEQSLKPEHLRLMAAE